MNLNARSTKRVASLPELFDVSTVNVGISVTEEDDIIVG